jgi:hypothetical protein
MVWVVEKKIFYHILDMGFESVGIPVRVKFEFDVQEGRVVADSLSLESLYHQQAIFKRYPGVNMDALDKEIQRTVQQEICNYLHNCGYVLENSANKIED